MLDEFKNAKIAVIGDVILDEYVEGKVNRISPEAPIPILAPHKEYQRLGGAANVAHNIVSLGASCTLFGQIGKDTFASKVRSTCEKLGITANLFDFKEHTIVKRRYIALGQQLLRVDWEKKTPLPEEYVAQIAEKLSGFDIIIVSDYAKGFITEKLMAELKKSNTKIFVDPRPANKEYYKDVFVICPNRKEAGEMSHKDDIESMGLTLSKEYNANIIITRSEEGVSLFENNEHKYLPALALEVADVSGAGDTFVAACALATATNKSLKEAIHIANVASSIAVQKHGTYAVKLDELKQALENES